MSNFSPEFSDEFAIRDDLKHYEPVPEVVRLAEMVLAEAKAGRFVEIAIAAVRHDGHHKHAFCGSERVEKVVGDLPKFMASA